MHDRRLNAFYTVAKLRSFTAAAKELSLTQPTVSFQIRQLESYYGIKLIESSSRQFNLTEAGEIVFQYAARISRLYQEMDQTVFEAAGTALRQLIMGASATPGEYILPGIIGDFQALNPGISIFVRISNTRKLIELLKGDHIDLAVIGQKLANSDLLSLLFTTDEMVLVTAPGSKYASLKEINPQNFNDIPLILREEGSISRDEVLRALQGAGIKLQQLRQRLTLGSNEAIKRAVEAGTGVAVMSRWMVLREIEQGTLKAIPIANITLERQFYFVCKAHHYKLKLISQFIKFARDYNMEALRLTNN